VLTIEVQYFEITFVNRHASTEKKTQEEKDEFYDNSEHTLNKIPRSRIRIVLGDFNAKLEKENNTTDQMFVIRQILQKS
jgi:hypothetical protein